MKIKKNKNSALEGLIWEAIQAYPIDTLGQFVLDPDERVRFTAARRLQLHGGEFACKLALKLIKSKNLDLRRTGIFIVGQLGYSIDNFSEKGREILIELLKDKSEKIKRDTLVALGHLGDESTIPFILKFANDKSEKTRVAAAFALIGFDGNEMAKKALKKLAKDKSSRVRYWAD